MEISLPIDMIDGKLVVPENPIIPYIEGDGIGADIWAASQHVFDQAIIKAYNGEKNINWLEIFAGEKSFNKIVRHLSLFLYHLSFFCLYFFIVFLCAFPT